MSDKNWIAQPKEDRSSKEKPWEVKKEKASRASKDFKTREKAWDWAKEKAKGAGTKPHPAKAKLKLRRDGTFTKTRKYPRKSNKRRM